MATSNYGLTPLTIKVSPQNVSAFRTATQTLAVKIHTLKKNAKTIVADWNINIFL